VSFSLSMAAQSLSCRIVTPQETTGRAAVERARHVVIKIGSSTLAADQAVYHRLARAAERLRAERRTLVIVSSGAIALGTKKLGFRSRPKEMAKLQAAAAAGQSLLMRAYEEAFEVVRIPVAQVLLTHSDLADRTRANNARAALGALLESGAVPVLNENDSVAVDEIKFGDNDQLASLVVPLVDADLLVLLSDVEGLLDAEGARVPVVERVADVLGLVRTSAPAVGTGGMASKLEAARRATLAGASAVIADARDADALEGVLAGRDIGTLFLPAHERLGARRHWIAFTLRPRGELVLDRGASEAVRTKGKSVLAVGVLGVRGDFNVGDAVRLVDPDGVELGRGLSRCSAVEACRLAGKKSERQSAVLVHRDDLVSGEV
jgi:glutamate 5-kinase